MNVMARASTKLLVAPKVFFALGLNVLCAHYPPRFSAVITLVPKLSHLVV